MRQIKKQELKYKIEEKKGILELILVNGESEDVKVGFPKKKK